MLFFLVFVLHDYGYSYVQVFAPRSLGVDDIYERYLLYRSYLLDAHFGLNQVHLNQVIHFLVGLHHLDPVGYHSRGISLLPEIFLSWTTNLSLN